MKRGRENPKETRKVPQVPKVRTRVKPRKLVYQVLKTRNQRQAQKLRNLYRRVPLKIPTPIPGVIDDGWSYDEWNDDWRSIGWHEGWDQTYDNSASSFHLEVLILVP